MRRSRWQFIACFACRAGRTAHQLRTLLYTFPTPPGGPRFAPINGPLGEHTQAAQGRVRASDALDTGKVIRRLTIVDECRRESPAIEVDTSLGKFRVRRVLDRIALERGPLEASVLHNGPFFVLCSLAGIICSLQVGFACARTAPDLISLLRPEQSRLRLPDCKRRNSPCSVRLRTTDSVTGQVGFRNLWPADRLCFINGGLGVAAVGRLFA